MYCGQGGRITRVGKQGVRPAAITVLHQRAAALGIALIDSAFTDGLRMLYLQGALGSAGGISAGGERGALVVTAVDIRLVAADRVFASVDIAGPVTAVKIAGRGGQPGKAGPQQTAVNSVYGKGTVSHQGKCHRGRAGKADPGQGGDDLVGRTQVSGINLIV